MSAGHHHGHAHGPHDHDHHHDHDDPRARSRRALLGSLLLNGAFLVLEAGVGWWTGSLALLSDAAHMVSDVAALSLALGAAHLALRPATRHRTFGLLRAEILGAFVNAVAMLVVCTLIFKEAVERLVDGPPAIEGLPVLLVGAAGLAINLGSAWFLWRSDRTNLNIRGALVHMLADALGSVGAMVAAGLTLGFGWYAADPIASFVIGLLVLWGTWGILRDSTQVLLEYAPPGLGQDVVERELREIEGLADLHELHVWTLGSGQATVTAHLVPAPGVAADELLRRAEHHLREHLGVRHSTLQIESAGGAACAQSDCPLLREGPRPIPHGHDHHHH